MGRVVIAVIVAVVLATVVGVGVVALFDRAERAQRQEDER